MNYAQYMRKIMANQKQVIGYQNGQDSSLQTHKVQARAQSEKYAGPVATSFTQIGGSIANITQNSQQNCSPTNSICSSGYKGVIDGRTNADATGNILGSAEKCAVCSDQISAPYAVELPCKIFIDPVSNAPGQTKCCSKSMGILYSDPRELIENQQRQADLRKRYGLPSKLQGLRGPILTSR